MKMMKKMKMLTAALLLVAAVAVSCEKNNRNGKENPHPIGSYPNDDVELLVNQIVSVDESGNILRTRGGLQIDESDPGKITIAMDTYEDALAYFKGLMPGGADNFANGDNYIWNLKDTLANNKGQAVLKKVTEADDGRVAEIELPLSARPLTSVVFIPKSAMPLNDDYFDILVNCEGLDYLYLGAEVKLEKISELPTGVYMEGKSFGRGKGKFVVIQDYDPGTRDGVLIRLETTNHNYITNGSDSDTHRGRASFHWDLQKVHNILDANPSLHTNLKDAGMNDWAHHFMCRKDKKDKNDYRYHLRDDKGLQELYLTASWYYYEAYVYSFNVEKISEDDEEPRYGVEIHYM